MRFLNRVHFDAEMYPLELEMYHQVKNIIGVDPQFYEVRFAAARARMPSRTSSLTLFARSSCLSSTPIRPSKPTL